MGFLSPKYFFSETLIFVLSNVIQTSLGSDGAEFNSVCCKYCQSQEKNFIQYG